MAARRRDCGMRSRAGFTGAERAVLARLRRPEDVQRFLDEDLAYNKEIGGETNRSPRRVLRDRTAHCFEGALLAAAALRHHGRPPILVLLRAERDDDHVLALFRERRGPRAFGAVAKSNYAGLRFREPVYHTLRELAMSYFEHYYNLEAEKSLRSFSRPLDMSRFDACGWETAEADLWYVNDALQFRTFTSLLVPAQIRRLRKVDERLELAGLVGSVGVAPSRERKAAR